MAVPDASATRPQVRLILISLVCIMLGMALGGLVGNGFEPRSTGPLSPGEGIGLAIGTLVGIGTAALIARATLAITPIYGLTFLGGKLGDRLAGEGATSWLGLLAGAAVGLAIGTLLAWLIAKVASPTPERVG